jgi:hypothetical protein
VSTSLLRSTRNKMATWSVQLFQLPTKLHNTFTCPHEMWGYAISGFHHEVDKKCVILGYYTASSINSLLTFQDNRSIPSSRLDRSVVCHTNIVLCITINNVNFCGQLYKIELRVMFGGCLGKYLFQRNVIHTTWHREVHLVHAFLCLSQFERCSSLSN